MPDIADALDLQRFDELARNADLAVNLWSAFGLACEEGTAPASPTTPSKSPSSPDQLSLW